MTTATKKKKLPPMSDSPNTNCLAEFQCPECGSFGPFDLDVTIRTTVTMTDMGTDYEGGDTEWDGKSPCRCCECDHEGTAKQFTSRR